MASIEPNCEYLLYRKNDFYYSCTMLRRKKGKSSYWFDIPIIGFLLGILLLLAFIFLKPTFFSNHCANSLSCTDSFTMKVENGEPGVFNNQLVSVPSISLEDDRAVLGTEDQNNPEKPAAEKHIYINLKTQTLSAYDGDVLFMTARVSSGLWGKTPKGEFTIWTKIRSTRMTGGSGADYYNLPNVPYTMFFSNAEVPASRGFGIHGAYWHNNFGHAMSHGCINMREVDVAKLYEWANRGTTITILSGEEDVQE